VAAAAAAAFRDYLLDEGARKVDTETRTCCRRSRREVNATQRANPASANRGPGGIAEFRGALAKLARDSGRDEASCSPRRIAIFTSFAAATASSSIHARASRPGAARLGLRAHRLRSGPGRPHARAVATSPAVVLSSHKSYLDGGALTSASTITACRVTVSAASTCRSGTRISMRRANMVFIRRGATMRSTACTLRHYLAYLVSQRRPLQWFLEGTRSRTGKLGPPRLGLLVYIADAYRTAGSRTCNSCRSP